VEKKTLKSFILIEITELSTIFLTVNSISVMFRKTPLLVAILMLAFIACTSKKEAEDAAKKSPSPSEAAAPQPEVHGTEVKAIELTNPLNKEWVSAGKVNYELKCLACHKLSNEKLVGPGWAGVTKRREPLWIMNMITNVDMMLEKDPEAQKMLEECLVRMPNQNISQEDARKLIEFMRSNDGEK
jgi:cytochrome c5